MASEAGCNCSRRAPTAAWRTSTSTTRPEGRGPVAGRSTCSLRPSRTSTRAPRRGGAMPWAVAPGPRRHPRWWNRCDFGCSTPGSPWGSSFRLRRTLGAGPQWPPFNRCGLLLFRGEPGVLHPMSHRFHHSKWRLRPGATAQDLLRPRRGARVLYRPDGKVVVWWAGTLSLRPSQTSTRAPHHGHTKS